jgi:hypothetical protein
VKKFLVGAALLWLGRWAALMLAAYLERRRPASQG